MSKGGRDRLVQQALNQGWYHTIDLGDGVATPGSVDLRRPAAELLPADLSGKRALDVGTFDGFYAFELERRGAEVVATDLDRFDEAEWPPPARDRLAAEAGDTGPGERFYLAHEILESRVRRVTTSIYDISAERIGGTVDFAILGALLIHLRDPVGALEAIRSALAPGATLLSIDAFDEELERAHPEEPVARLETTYSDYNWWRGNVACLSEWIRTAGFDTVRRVAEPFRLDAVEVMQQGYVALEAR